MYHRAEAQIRDKVRMVVANEATFGVLSCGERIAVALVLDRYDLLQRAWGTMAESVHRLGQEWTDAALRVQRDGWGDPADRFENASNLFTHLRTSPPK